LAALFAGETPTADGTDLSFEDLVQRIVIGGWPELLDVGEDDARDWLSDYLTQIAEIDVQSLGVAAIRAMFADCLPRWAERSGRQPRAASWPRTSAVPRGRSPRRHWPAASTLWTACTCSTTQRLGAPHALPRPPAHQPGSLLRRPVRRARGAQHGQRCVDRRLSGIGVPLRGTRHPRPSYLCPATAWRGRLLARLQRQ
jgi:hypothetical protein